MTQQNATASIAGGYEPDEIELAQRLFESLKTAYALVPEDRINEPLVQGVPTDGETLIDGRFDLIAVARAILERSNQGVADVDNRE